MTTVYQPNSTEGQVSQLIETGILQARAERRTIDIYTARRIAACLHRGLGGELATFAGTGRLSHVHAARLELFYSARGEAGLQEWRRALKNYLRHHGQDVANDRGSNRHQRPITPPPAGMSCDPDAAIAYLRTDQNDPVTRPGLALHMQHEACRAYIKDRLHRRLSAVFADRPGSHAQGLAKLLAHLAACHNHQVVVHRLDRLPPGSSAAKQVAKLGARVLSATEHHTRTLTNQAALNTDLNRLTSRKEIS